MERELLVPVGQGSIRGFLKPVGCDTWRANGIAIYLNDGRLEERSADGRTMSLREQQKISPHKGRDYTKCGRAKSDCEV
jgi:hypothetical protein